jgi:hypothetical protein
MPNILPGTITYLVRSFDGEALQFSFPLLIRRELLTEIDLDPAGSDGAISALIECIKEHAHHVPELGYDKPNLIPSQLRPVPRRETGGARGGLHS